MVRFNLVSRLAAAALVLAACTSVAFLSPAFAQAPRAAERAVETAGDGRDRLVAIGALGDVLIDQSDFAGARTRFEQSLAMAQRLAAADPSSAEAQHDVAISHERLGDVLVAQGDLTGALAAYRERERIIQRLAAAEPSNASLQREVGVSLTISAMCWSPRAIFPARAPASNKAWRSDNTSLPPTRVTRRRGAMWRSALRRSAVC